MSERVTAEERIDHEEAKRIAENLRATADTGRPHPLLYNAAALIDALLTEHFAREEALRHIASNDAPSNLPIFAPGKDWKSELAKLALAALPATEPAQPEEERRG